MVNNLIQHGKNNFIKNNHKDKKVNVMFEI